MGTDTLVPSVVPGVMPSTACAPDWAAAVLLLQATEACSQDEGPEPGARWQVRGSGAPSAAPVAQLVSPASLGSAVRTDPGTMGSRWSRLRAWAVLGQQDKHHLGGTCLSHQGLLSAGRDNLSPRLVMFWAEQPPSCIPGRSSDTGVRGCSANLPWAGFPARCGQGCGVLCCNSTGTSSLGAELPLPVEGELWEWAAFRDSGEAGKAVHLSILCRVSWCGHESTCSAVLGTDLMGIV